MTRTRDPEATKAAIFEAAESIFLEKGLGNTAVSEIAKQAGVTKSLIHHHFGSKEGLWQAVKYRRFMDYAAKQMSMIQQSPATTELLRESMILYFNFLKENPQVVRILAWMFLERDQQDDECVTADRKLIEAGVEKIKEGQAAGGIRTDIDPRFVLLTFVGIAQHWFQDKTHFCHSFDQTGLSGDLDEAYMRDALKIFFEGVLPR